MKIKIIALWIKTFKKCSTNTTIKLYHTFNGEKLSLIERFNRILNEKLKICFEVNNNHKWIDPILKKIIE